MAEVVRPELQFEALLRLAIRRHRDARVTGEDVESDEGPCIGGRLECMGYSIIAMLKQALLVKAAVPATMQLVHDQSVFANTRLS